MLWRKVSNYFVQYAYKRKNVWLWKRLLEHRDSDIWYQQWYGRLTASSFHSILTMKKQTESKVADRLLKNEDLSYIPAVKWGIDKEDIARQTYTKEILSSHQDFHCTKADLVINSLYPHLGASPDGLVSCSCCGDGLVEIKCPFSVKDDHLDILREKPRSFLNKHGLVMTHKYYTRKCKANYLLVNHIKGSQVIYGNNKCVSKCQMIQNGLHVATVIDAAQDL